MMMDVDSHYASSSAPGPPSPISSAPTVKYFRDLSSPARPFDASFHDLSSPERSSDGPFHDLSSPSGGSPTLRAPFPVGGNPFAPPTVSTPPASGPAHKKRRSLSPEGSHRDLDSDATFASPLARSPADRKLRRMASGSLLAALCNASSPAAPGASVSSALDPSPELNMLKRPRRPALNPLAPAVGAAPEQHSAFPILSGAPGHAERRAPAGLPSFQQPSRRAFSARLTRPSQAMLADMSGDESSFDASVDMSSPAQAVARRAQGRTLRRSNGTDDFRQADGSMQMSPRATVQESPSARYMRPGMPGFGDNEAHGKILPCHRVKEDGLMRIKVETVRDALSRMSGRALTIRSSTTSSTARTTGGSRTSS